MSRLHEVTEMEGWTQIRFAICDLPYASIAEFGEAVKADDSDCSLDWSHPHAERWVTIRGWLWLLGIDWRDATAQLQPPLE